MNLILMDLIGHLVTKRGQTLINLTEIMISLAMGSELVHILQYDQLFSLGVEPANVADHVVLFVVFLSGLLIKVSVLAKYAFGVFGTVGELAEDMVVQLSTGAVELDLRDQAFLEFEADLTDHLFMLLLVVSDKLSVVGQEGLALETIRLDELQ